MSIWNGAPVRLFWTVESITVQLVQRPTEGFKLLYQFLGEEPYAHDFSAVACDAPRFDSQLGLDGPHRAHAEGAPRPRETILPPHLFERYSQTAAAGVM